MEFLMKELFGASPGGITWWQMSARAAVIFFYAVILFRLLPRRAFSGFAPADLAVMVILGSSLSRALTGNAPLFATLTSAAVFAGLYVALMYLAQRSAVFSRLAKGRPVLLMKDGRICWAALSREKLTEADLEETLRLQGLTVGPQCADDLGAFAQPRVALVFRGPALAHDLLVQRLAAAQAHPAEPAREHLRQCRAGLRQDGGMISPAAGHGDRAEGQIGGLHRRAEPRPRKAGLALGVTPEVEMVGGHDSAEAGPLRALNEFHKLSRRELLVRGVEANERRSR